MSNKDEDISSYSTDKILELVGNSNKYQYTVVIILFMIALSCEVGFYGVPMMLTTPVINYIDKQGDNHTTLMNYSMCKFNHTLVLSESKSTWVIDFEIYCDKFKVSMLGTLMCLGGLTGTVLVQYIKTYGSRYALLVSCIINITSTFLLLFPNLLFLYLADFFLGMSNIMSFMLRINIMSEITGKHNRAHFNNFILSGGGTSLIIVYLIFENNYNWRFIYFGSAALLVISTSLFYFLTVENFRYFFIKGDYTQMIASINYIANFNDKTNLLQLDEEIKKMDVLGNKHEKLAYNMDIIPPIVQGDSAENEVKMKNFSGTNNNEGFKSAWEESEGIYLLY